MMDPNSAANPETPVKYKARDFQTDQDVRWCPGCGDYAILAQVQRLLPELGIPKEKFAFISGIGCSSRFPYYLNTYGFHGIHGRATAIASGVKIANPGLSVWVATGDGDALSIGGNHFIHACRRNIDINILLFNNEIYALTKGQFSPTSRYGQVTKSSPMGNIDHPFNPVLLALGAEASFIARAMDRDQRHLHDVLKRAAEHKGTSFVEIYQNCVVFNDGAFLPLTEKETRDDNVLYIEHGKPLVFANGKKGIRMENHRPVLADLTTGHFSLDDLLIYDETNPALAYTIALISDNPSMPRPVGVFTAVTRATFEDDLLRQISAAKSKYGERSLESLFNQGETWEIKAQ